MDYPTTLSQAVDRLLSMLTEDQKEQVRSTMVGELPRSHVSLAMKIRNEFGMWKGNVELVRSCCEYAAEIGRPCMGEYPDEASMIIVDRLWERLYVG